MAAIVDSSSGADAVSGERFLANDRLRFSVRVPGPGHVVVVGVEADGTLYRCHPQDDDVSRAVAHDGTLPGAIALDDSSGEEWLFLVWCEEPFTLGQLSSSAAGVLEDLVVRRS